MTEPDPEVLPLATVESAERFRRVRWPRVVIMLGGAGWVGLLVVAVATGSFELLDPVFQIPVLALLTIPLARRVARSDRDPAMYEFVMAALSAKLIGAVVRSVVTTGLYGGISDSSEYHLYGKFLAPFYRQFDFSPDVGAFSGTGFLRTVTGVIYSVAGTSELGGGIIFSWLSFVGLLLLWRAFCRAVPDGAHRRYGLLVLFLPSMLYWPSALGKDAWAVFGLGLASYGVARVLTWKVPSGLGFLVAGIASVALLRPHVALTVFCGIVLAAALAKPNTPNAKTPVVRTVVFGVLVVVGFLLVSQTQSFFGVERLDQETINQQLSKAEGRTDEGGSTFTPVRMDNPIKAPLAFVTVLFRPFPFEAHNLQSLIGSAEGMFLIILSWTSRRRLASIPRLARERPYVSYCIGITFTFVFAFSAFSNFGILSRQRVQVMPFYLVLICLPERPRPERAKFTPELETLAVQPDEPYEQPKTVDPYATVRRDQERDLDPYARFAGPKRPLGAGQGPPDPDAPDA